MANSQRTPAPPARVNRTETEPWPNHANRPQGQASFLVLLLPFHDGEFKQFIET